MPIPQLNVFNISRLFKLAFFCIYKKISGIFNGTTNFILSEMHKSNSDYFSVLKIAQNNGFAETDPKNDIEGVDSAHKLSLLTIPIVLTNIPLIV